MNARTFLFSALALFGFYLLSLGPGLYVLIKTERTIRAYVPNLAYDIVGTVYLPHIYAVAYSETYYNYGKWWIEVAGEKISQTYPEFRAHLLSK